MSSSLALLRSSAVAQLAGMPVATLRIWEQRYQAVQPAATASGHRLYSADDVRRVVMLRQLTRQGHSISSIAPLTNQQLRALLQDEPAAMPERSRTVVVGTALHLRLSAPPIQSKLAHALELLAPAETLAEALLHADGRPCQLMLWQLPALQNSVPIELQAARRNWPACQLGVVYRYASPTALASYAAAGIALLADTADDAALVGWLAPLISAASSSHLPPATSSPHATSASPATLATQLERPAAMAAIAAEHASHAATRQALASAAGSPLPLPIAPRQFDDAVLVAIAAMAPALECQCPQHIAGLLRQLADFEIYSAGCAHDSPADAALHTELQQIAATARTLFEQALVKLAQLKDLTLTQLSNSATKDPS